MSKYRKVYYRQGDVWIAEGRNERHAHSRAALFNAIKTAPLETAKIRIYDEDEGILIIELNLFDYCIV